MLSTDAPNAWDVQRELEASFPGTRLGLNYVYRTYKPYRAASQPEMLPKGTARKGCSAELCYGPEVIHWNKSLAVCAAGLKVGMIDTSIDEAHPAFPPNGVKVFDLARKRDAPPAVHWHGTGVLSLMAGVADSSTPGLIPGAAFSAANVFFTNKDGELETDTAHLTEALAAMKAEKVRVVNMSLVGPQDKLVHERITDMTTNDGVVFVAAAGNGGPDALPGYPAAYEEVIAVTAVDRNKASYDHANRGTYIDMAAPGVQILAALPGGKEGLLSGTSFAAPFVTAVVAVAYRDTGLEKAVKEGRGRLDPKGVMLSHLFRKDELQTRSPIKGYGLVRAPEKCGSGGGSDSWASIVKPTPSVPVSGPTVLARPATGSIALDSWQGQTIVQQAFLPGESAK
jgi:subtilisin family serine protease